MAWNEFKADATVADVDNLVRERLRRDKASKANKGMVEMFERDQQNHRPSDGMGSTCTKCGNQWPCESLRVIAFELD